VSGERNGSRRAEENGPSKWAPLHGLPLFVLIEGSRLRTLVESEAVMGVAFLGLCKGRRGTSILSLPSSSLSS
jgi:hypothetical protein